MITDTNHPWLGDLLVASKLGWLRGTFTPARSGCGADLGRRPLTAAARGCTFPLWRIAAGPSRIRRGSSSTYTFNWYQNTMEQSALRTVSCSYGLKQIWNLANLVSNGLTHRYLHLSNNYMKWVSILPSIRVECSNDLEVWNIIVWYYLIERTLGTCYHLNWISPSTVFIFAVVTFLCIIVLTFLYNWQYFAMTIQCNLQLHSCVHTELCNH